MKTRVNRVPGAQKKGSQILACEVQQNPGEMTEAVGATFDHTHRFFSGERGSYRYIQLLSDIFVSRLGVGRAEIGKTVTDSIEMVECQRPISQAAVEELH